MARYVINSYVNPEGSLNCPVSGLPIRQKPEWTYTTPDKGYTVIYSVVGDNILFVRSFGRATLAGFENVLDLSDKVEKESFSGDHLHIRVEDFTDLQGVAPSVRSHYIKVMKQKRCQKGLIFFGLSPFLRLSIKLAKRLHITPFEVFIAGDHPEAIEIALKLMPDKKGVRAGSAKPEWLLTNNDYSLKFKVIGSDVLVAYPSGITSEEDIPNAMQMQADIIKSYDLTRAGGSYYFVLDATDSTRIDRKARKPYMNAILALHKKYPIGMFIFLGVDRILKAAINITRPFAPFRVRVMGDLNTALKAIGDDRSKRGRVSPLKFANLLKKKKKQNKSGDETDTYVEEVLQFIGSIEWEDEDIDTMPVINPAHPFSEVFDALSLIKSDLDELLEDLRLAKEKAEQANIAKSVFLANMGHELRTPLNAVIGFSEILIENSLGELNQGQEKYVESIRDNGRNLLFLINEILNLSTLEAGMMKIDNQIFNLHEHLTNCMDLIKENADAKGILTHLSINENVPELVSGDARKYRHIFVNLLTNALKFTENGEIRVRVEQKKAADTDLPMISTCVSDTGIGIPVDKQATVFDIFTQADGSFEREYGGSGLGLAICKRMLDIMGGTISLESREGSGSQFTFELPFREMDVRHLDDGEMQSHYPEPVENISRGTDDGYSEQTATGINSRLKASVQLLPFDTVNEMIKALESGDMFELETLIKKVSGIDPGTAKDLMVLAEQYDYEALMQLFRGKTGGSFQ